MRISTAMNQTLLFLLFSSASLLADPTPVKKPAEVDLTAAERRVFSQNGEDGILEKLFTSIGTTSKFYVEFNADDGMKYSNTRYLRENAGWKGVLLDSKYVDPKINLNKEIITAQNVNQVFEKYKVPTEFDLLSIDMDYNDFYVWKGIDEKYKPRVVVIEYNGGHLLAEDKVVEYKPGQNWDGTNYFGASLLALANLGKQKGYTLVYADNNGVNLFFVRNDVLKKSPVAFKNAGDVAKLYKKAKYGRGPNGGHIKDPKNRAYLTSTAILAAPVATAQPKPATPAATTK